MDMEKDVRQDTGQEEEVWLDPQVIAAIQSLREKLEALEAQIKLAEEAERKRAEERGWDREEEAEQPEPAPVEALPAEEPEAPAPELPGETIEPPAAEAEAEEEDAPPPLMPRGQDKADEVLRAEVEDGNAPPVLWTPRDPSDPSGAPRTQAEEDDASRPKGRGGSRVLIACLVIVGLAVISWFFAWPMQVQNDLMAPLLNQGDWVLINRLNHEHRFSDVVMLQDGRAMRVAGLPGDEMRLDEGSGLLLRNGILVETAIPEDGQGVEVTQALSTLVPQGSVFLTGDNGVLLGEDDPDAAGIAKNEAIQGKPWLKIYPFDRFGMI